ncbi:hypothetical protein HDU92_001387 [Lobulomyces angularis]|nr:hypothetical protein HDU92_001387 [Lobulomyces angularis]
MVIVLFESKFACEKCIKGHRSSTCDHLRRDLLEVNSKGRPLTQCENCRTSRKSGKLVASHHTCICRAAAKGKKYTSKLELNIKNDSANPVSFTTITYGVENFDKFKSDLLSNNLSLSIIKSKKEEPKKIFCGYKDLTILEEKFEFDEVLMRANPCKCQFGGECICSKLSKNKHSPVVLSNDLNVVKKIKTSVSSNCCANENGKEGCCVGGCECATDDDDGGCSCSSRSEQTSNSMNSTLNQVSIFSLVNSPYTNDVNVVDETRSCCGSESKIESPNVGSSTSTSITQINSSVSPAGIFDEQNVKKISCCSGKKTIGDNKNTSRSMHDLSNHAVSNSLGLSFATNNSQFSFIHGTQPQQQNATPPRIIQSTSTYLSPATVPHQNLTYKPSEHSNTTYQSPQQNSNYQSPQQKQHMLSHQSNNMNFQSPRQNLNFSFSPNMQQQQQQLLQNSNNGEQVLQNNNNTVNSHWQNFSSHQNSEDSSHNQMEELIRAANLQNLMNYSSLNFNVHLQQSHLQGDHVNNNLAYTNTVLPQPQDLQSASKHQVNINQATEDNLWFLK